MFEITSAAYVYWHSQEIKGKQELTKINFFLTVM